MSVKETIPKVDVLIITRDRSELLLRAVTFLLLNTNLPENIIIIDNSVAINAISIFFRKTVLKLLDQSSVPYTYKEIPEIKGVDVARSKGLSLVKSRYVAFLDDDQIPDKDWILNIQKYFQKNASVVGLGGKRTSHYENNYWNQIWEKIEVNRYLKTNKIHFIPGGNSIFDIQYIHKNKIKIRIFKGVIEDYDFCQQILAKGGKLDFDSSIIVFDDFRTSLRSFFRQWYYYGLGTFSFSRQSIDLHASSKLKNFFFHFFHIFKTIESLSIPNLDKKYKFGFFIRDIAFFSGYLAGFLSL
ncbi:MAG: glycosyltransferase [Patescibacteria group bacterium]